MLNPAASNSSIARSLIVVPTRASRNAVLSTSSRGSGGGEASIFATAVTRNSVARPIVARVNRRRTKRLEQRMSSEQNRRRWIALAVLVAAQFMVVLDVAIVNVALPSIKTDLNFSQESLQWVVTSYAILF